MKITALNLGYFKLDGGAMFGVIPKVMWNKLNPSEENNLNTWALRCLLLEYDDKKVLIDTGNGDKQDAKFFALYHQTETKPIFEALKECGVLPEEITDVILTHLHFDHVGGAVNKNIDGTLVPALPKAKYWTNQRHYDWANNPNAREKASFLKENFVPLKEANVLHFIPEGKMARFDDKIALYFVEGHTEAMMVPIIKSPKGTIAYCADLIPSHWHIGLPYIMGYDIRPMQTLEEKTWFLESAFENGWSLIFEHDPIVACCKVTKNIQGRIVAGEQFAIKDL